MAEKIDNAALIVSLSLTHSGRSSRTVFVCGCLAGAAHVDGLIENLDTFPHSLPSVNKAATLSSPASSRSRAHVSSWGWGGSVGEQTIILRQFFRSKAGKKTY